jgi:hypothetical protein
MAAAGKSAFAHLKNEQRSIFSADDRNSETKTREADLSTLEDRAEAPPWLSRPDGDGRRPEGDRRPARAGPQEAFGLIDQIRHWLFGRQ